MVQVDLARGLWSVRAGGSGWTCRRDFPGTETCARTTALAPGQATAFLVQTLVLARPGTVLTSAADVTWPSVTRAGHHASDTTRSSVSRHFRLPELLASPHEGSLPVLSPA